MKILVVGLACSGKSIFARRLGAELKLPVFHMDQLLWQEEWVKTPDKTFKQIQQQILEKDKWIYEGFNLPTLRTQVEAADRIVYLKKSHVQITLNYFKRLREYRYMSRPDIPKGNIEHFSLHYIKWLWKYNNLEIINEVQQYSKEKSVDILSTNNDIQNFISWIGKPSG
jgi:adenylate kinase family enzyme